MYAVSQALLGEVSGALRRVYVTQTPKTIHLDCYFDGEISTEDQESMSCVETELWACFPEDHAMSHAVIRLDYPGKFPVGDDVAYSRRES